MRYIDGDALYDRFQNLSYDDWNQGTGTTWANAFAEAADVVDDMPTEDVAPVRHGRWIDEGQYADFFPHHAYRCSECGNHFLEVEMYYEFCPRCGAKMER